MKMKRTKTRLQALKGSIRKWKLIVDGKGVDNGGDNCPLCQKYREFYCEKCPVMKATEETSCDGSPYENWMWFSVRARKPGLLPKVVDVNTRNAAKAELAFLKSLLPKRK